MDKRRYKRVFIVGVDGAGTFFREAKTPNLDRIFANGNVTYEATTAIPSISAECWGSMFYGVAPQRHKLYNWTVGYLEHKMDSPYPSFYRIVREHYPDAELGCYTSWNAVNIGILERELNISQYSGTFANEDELENRWDQDTVKYTLEYLEKNDPMLFHIHIDTCDTYGHRCGYGSPEHIARIEMVDDWIGQVYDKQVELGRADDMLFIVLPDHGGCPLNKERWGCATHGGVTDAELKIMIAAAGKDVIPGSMKHAEIQDIFAIVLYAFGIDIPDHVTANVPDNLFRGYEYHERRVDDFAEKLKEETKRKMANAEKVDVPEIEKLQNFFPLRSDLFDHKGDIVAIPHNKLYFLPMGDMIGTNLQDGYITFEKLRFGNKSFSLGLWTQLHDTDGDFALLGNTDAVEEGNCMYGLFMKVKDHALDVCLEGDTTGWTAWHEMFRNEKAFPLTSGEQEPMHLLWSVDRKNNHLDFYINFENVWSEPLEERFGLSGSIVDSLDFTIGQDGSGNYPACNFDYAAPAPATVCDFMVFNDALDASDVKKLKEFYNK